jgi:acetyl esterase/lipase
MANELPIWPGVAPGSERSNLVEAVVTDESGAVRVHNVVRPTLTPYRPDPEIANGTAVVVAPGGGFHYLAWDYEGLDVATWLVARGVTAFVLKYRLVDTGATEEEISASVAALHLSLQTESERWSLRPGDLAPEVEPLAVADGEQAIRYVRAHAGEWGIDPERVGMLGFSAGAFVTTAVALTEDPAARPSFVAPIYGGGAVGEVPLDVPPLFCAVASDDPLCLDSTLRTYQAWQAAGRPAELHVYESGGHGFGTNKLGLPVDSWMDRLADWMQSRGLLAR